MVNTYPSELINSLCNNWASAKSVDFKLKILEILNFSSIPIEYFYAIVCQCINQDKIGKKRRPGQLELEQSL